MIEKCYVVPIQKNCNCNCVFCITKSRIYDKSVEKLICDEKFKSNITLLKNKNIKKFEITGGGEPFLNENLDNIISTIKTIIPDSYIKLYTNGNILKSIYNIDELNISVTHYDANINNKYMNSNNNINFIDKIKFFRISHPKVKIRLSIVLLKGAIDCKEELDKMINLTKEYVDEYVVRTLYPHSIDIKKYYADFSYEHKLVTLEKDNDINEFDGIILWSDNNFYNNWNLDNERYLHSYLLLKPDSRIYINEIEKLIYEQNFQISRKILLNDFYNSAILLYQNKPLEYLKLIRKHIESISYLFGNEGLIFMLNKNDNIENLIKDTYSLKKCIRNKYSFTQRKNGYLNIDDIDYHINLVHSPDPIISLYDKDIKIINQIKNSKEISEQEFQLIKKYRSYKIL